MSDIMSLEEFKSFFLKPCINRTRVVTGKTKEQFEEKVGISLDKFLDHMLEIVYNEAASYDEPLEEKTEGD